jgi:hypothetical protein
MMPEKIPNRLADCSFIVEADGYGKVSARLYAGKHNVDDALINAVCNEIESALEDALRGS